MFLIDSITSFIDQLLWFEAVTITDSGYCSRTSTVDFCTKQTLLVLVQMELCPFGELIIILKNRVLKQDTSVCDCTRTATSIHSHVQVHRKIRVLVRVIVEIDRFAYSNKMKNNYVPFHQMIRQDIVYSLLDIISPKLDKISLGLTCSTISWRYFCRFSSKSPLESDPRVFVILQSFL